MCGAALFGTSTIVRLLSTLTSYGVVNPPGERALDVRETGRERLISRKLVGANVGIGVSLLAGEVDVGAEVRCARIHQR